MRKIFKRTLSVVLAASMTASLAPTALAKAPAVSGESEISFSAAKYNVAENEKKLKVKLIRSGGNDRKVQVAFKTADFTAEYGADYVALDEDGGELSVTDGIAPDESEFKEITNGEGVTSETSEEVSPVEDIAQSEKSEGLEGTEQPEETEQSDEVQTVIADDGGVTKLESAIDMSETSVENAGRASTGSAVLDAQAAYLQLPDNDAETSAAVENVLTDLNGYFQNARGAVGVVTFDEGETEKEITIKLIDNDLPQADKIVIMSLMGVNGDDETSIAANPTAYINIMDDEPYENPVIEPDINEIELSAEKPSYDLVLTRTAGVDYYTSLTVSTVKGTAQEGYNYEKIDNAGVSFAPGETEKTVKICAENFGEEMDFGIRLESDGTCDITNEYIPVTMRKTEARAEIEPMSEDAGAELMSADAGVELMSAKTMGSQTTTKILDNFGFVKGPSTGKQDGRHSTSWNSGSRWTDYSVYETCRKSGRTWVAGNALNLTGIDKMNVAHQNDGDHGGSWAAYHMFVELLRSWDKWNYSSSGDRSFRKDGKHGWTWTDMNVSDLSGDYYLRFGVRNDGYPRDCECKGCLRCKRKRELRRVYGSL